MRQLVIETATTACSVALFDQGSLLAEHHVDVGRGHAERLIPMIADLPGRGRADEIIVDCGPGSFTGVRVGLAAARGLGLGWGVPVFGFSSLALLAASIERTDEHSLAVAIHGGHGQLFIQRFEHAPMQPVSELASLLPDAAAHALSDDLVVGNAGDDLVALRGFGTAVDIALRASNALRLPLPLRQLPPQPIYGRAPDAKPQK